MPTSGQSPDPSPRTLENIYREIKSLEDKIYIKFDGYDNAVRLLQEFANRQPTTEAVNGDVKALKELTGAELGAFKMLVDAMFKGNEVALNAALKTQKEGSDKIESNFTKQIDNVVETIRIMTKSFDDKINDLKDRFNVREGQHTGTSDSWKMTFSLVGVAVAIATVANIVISLMARV